MAAYYNEIDKFAAAWLRELIKAGCIAPGEVDERDIREVRPADLAGFTQVHMFAGLGGWSLALRQAGWPDERPVWSGSCPCFPADTLIHTKDGLVPIQDIRPGMEVLTHKKRWRTVVRTGSKPFQETIVLRGQGHYGLSCTPNHPFLTSEGSWVEANSMQHKRWVNASEQPATYVPKLENNRGILCRNGRYRACGTKNDRTVCLGTYATLEEARAARQEALRKGIIDVRGADKVDTTSLGFAYFLGRWIGDGWTYRDSIYLCDSHDKKQELIDTMSRANLSYSVSKERTATRIRCGSKQLTNWLEENFGKYSYGKKLPGWLLGAPIEYIKEFIKGYIESDECIYKKYITINTTSKQLAFGLKFLLLRLKENIVLTNVKSKTLFIEGRNIKNLREYVSVSWGKRSRSFYFTEMGGIGLVRKILPGKIETVYNLEVEEDHSYVADGIVVHNCQPFSSAGSHRGFSDERHLWPEFYRLIAECRPDTVFGEQVASQDGFRWLDLVCSDLEARNYAVGAVVTCAASAGAPHIRQRLYWVAESARGFDGGAGQSLHAERLADSDCTHGEGCAVHAGTSTGRQAEAGPGLDGGVRAFWDAACWLASPGPDHRTGKPVLRPVEPGFLPVAHGLPGTMEQLRCYGNALCVPQAQAFVEAFLGR